LIYEDAAPVVKSLVMALSILVGVVLMESTRSYAEIWQNEDRMWLYTMKYNWNCWQAHNRYGSRLFNRGNFDEALKHFTIATELRPDLAETQNNLGSAVLAQKDTKRAVKHFKEGLRLSPEIIAIKSNLARALFLDGQYGEALPIYKELATKFPKNAAFQCNLGVIEYQLGNYEASVRAFKQALEIDPGLEDAKRNLEQVLRDLKKSGL
jgi:tetratricopeptide (TPR) repeat protein